MGYDLLLMRFWQGKPLDVDEPEVWRLLEDAWDAPPDEHDFAHVVRGRGEADLYAARPGEPIDSLMFSRPAGGPEIFDLIVDLARAGDMVILAPGLAPRLIDEAQREHLAGDVAGDGTAIVIRSGRELYEAVLT